MSIYLLNTSLLILLSIHPLRIYQVSIYGGTITHKESKIIHLLVDFKSGIVSRLPVSPFVDTLS